MGRRPLVPDELRRVAFTAADAAAFGVSRTALTGASWSRIGRDVFAHREDVVLDEVRWQALALTLPPDTPARGLTAAWAYGVWQPRPGRPLPLQAARPRGAGPWGVNAVDGRRLVTGQAATGVPEHPPLVAGDLVERDVLVGPDRRSVTINVLSPLRTAFELMRLGPLVESVVVADAFAYAGQVDLVSLAVYIEEHRRWPGVRQARTAVQLADAGARSAGETRMRMVVVLGGLPEPRVNVPLLEATRWGGDRVLAIPDLLVVGKVVVGLEYDGAYHDEVEGQPTLDRSRGNRLVTVGNLPLLRYDARLLRTHPLRVAALDEICAVTGLRAPQDLRPRDFADPRLPFRW